MINKLKIGLIASAIGVLAMAGTALAATGVTYTSNTPVTINGRTYVIQSGSTATSVVVDATTLAVTLTDSGPFILLSENGDTLTNSGSVAAVCNSVTTTSVTLVATGTFTPTSVSFCHGPTGSSGSGTPSSSSSSSSSTSTVAQSTTPVTLTITPATSTTPATTMTTSTPGCSGGNKYNTSTGALCVNNAVVANNIPGCGSGTSGFSTASGVSCAGNVVGSSVSAAAGSYNLGTKTLKSGSKGDAVKELQRFLNDKLNLGLVVDGKLGPKTIAVIKKWQKDNGLVVDGLIGPKTKAKMNAQ